MNFEKLAKTLTDKQLAKMIQLSPFKDPYTFRGKYYTVKEGILKCQGSWEEVKLTIKQVLKIYEKSYALLKALVETTQAHLDS